MYCATLRPPVVAVSLAALACASAVSAETPSRWCDRLPRPANAQLERVAVKSDWYEVRRVADGVFAILEPRQFQEVISYLVVGRDRALLFDTGMGLVPIRPVVEELTRLPVEVLNSHTHHDHVGSNAGFDGVLALDTAFTRKNEEGRPHAAVADEARADAFCGDPPKGADLAGYRSLPWKVRRRIGDGERIDLGGRVLEVLGIPGHTPDSVALLDRANGLLWTGDSLYEGPLWLYGPDTDLAAYERSMSRLAGLAPQLRQLLPAHNTASVEPKRLGQVAEAIRKVRTGEVAGTSRGEQVEYPFDGFSILVAARLSLARRVDHVDLIAREPMVVEHPGGALFVAGYGSPHPTLWTSTDGGARWARVALGAGANGNSDVDLAVAPDGTLYFAAMTYDRETYEGRAISMGVSSDAGATWRWTDVSRTRFDDRPWVEVAPDGTAHLIWNDGSGVHHRVSRDRGLTWTNPGDVHDKGGSSHLAIGPKGELAVRVAPISASYNRFDAGVDLVAVSTDGGVTWAKREAPGTRDWGPTYDAKGYTPRWVEPLAWDAAGQLYSAWTDKAGLNVMRSADRGASWTAVTSLATPAPAFFPYMVARADGALALTWFTAAQEDYADLRAHLAIVGAHGTRQAEPWALESSRPRDESGKVFNDPGGEYLPVAFLRDGAVAVVSPIQNKAAGRMGFTFTRYRE